MGIATSYFERETSSAIDVVQGVLPDVVRHSPRAEAFVPRHDAAVEAGEGLGPHAVLVYQLDRRVGHLQPLAAQLRDAVKGGVVRLWGAKGAP